MSKSIPATAVTVLLLSLKVFGDTIDSDMTLDETSTIESIEVIDGVMPPTVIIIEGANLFQANVKDSSVLNVNNGSIRPEAWSLDAVGVNAWDESVINVFGGTISGSSEGAINLFDASRLNMSAGLVLAAFGHAVVHARGAETNVTVSGGVITGYDKLFGVLFEGAHLAISGGQIGDPPFSAPATPIVVRGDSTAEINGGVRVAVGAYARSVSVEENATVDIRGGEFRVFPGELQRTDFAKLVHATGSSTVNLYGGTVRIESVPGREPSLPSLVAEDMATINVFGRSLTHENNRLTGMLADGTPIEYGTSGNIVLHEMLLKLQAGDADRNFQFDALDVVRVSQAGKYLTGQPATWGEGDWDGAPGGTVVDPPAGNGLFDQMDIVAALQEGAYLTGRYVAVNSGGVQNDAQTSLAYDAKTGEISIDAAAGVELTSINLDSATGIFTGEAAQNLGGSFDNDADENIFKATFGSSFGSLSFGNVAQPGLMEGFLLSDLTVVGSLQGGGGLGDVDLVYIPVPEPDAVMLAVIALTLSLAATRPRTILAYLE